MEFLKKYVLDETNKILGILAKVADKRPEKVEDFDSLYFNLADGRVLSYSLQTKFISINFANDEDRDDYFQVLFLDDGIHVSMKFLDGQKEIYYSINQEEPLTGGQKYAIIRYMYSLEEQLKTMIFDEKATHSRWNMTENNRTRYNRELYNSSMKALKEEDPTSEYLPAIEIAAEWLAKFYSVYLQGNEEAFKNEIKKLLNYSLSFGDDQRFDSVNGIFYLERVFNAIGINVEDIPVCKTVVSVDKVSIIVPYKGEVFISSFEELEELLNSQEMKAIM